MSSRQLASTRLAWSRPSPTKVNKNLTKSTEKSFGASGDFGCHHRHLGQLGHDLDRIVWRIRSACIRRPRVEKTIPFFILRVPTSERKGNSRRMACVSRIGRTRFFPSPGDMLRCGEKLDRGDAAMSTMATFAQHSAHDRVTGRLQVHAQARHRGTVAAIARSDAAGFSTARWSKSL